MVITDIEYYLNKNEVLEDINKRIDILMEKNN